MLVQLIAAIFLLIIDPPSDDHIVDLKELLPGIHIGDGIIEFDGIVAIDCHHPETPDVFLEMLVTAPDSREHESLVVSLIKPSVLHAALLAGSFESGNPICKDKDGKRLPAAGDQLVVLVAVVDESNSSKPSFVPIETWAVHLETDVRLYDSAKWTGLVFAGSILNAEGYAADRAGTLISLTSFGDEVIAPTWLISSEASFDEPVWIANSDLVPKQGTPVRIRIEAVADDNIDEDSHKPDGIDIDRDP